MNYFNKLLSEILLEATSDKGLIVILKKSPVRYGQRTLGEFSEEELVSILDEIKSIIPQSHQKLIKYYVDQVARGYLPLSKIQEDSERIVNTIENFRQYSRAENWEGSRNLFDFKDWRELERMFTDFNTSTQPTNKAKDSIILFAQEYHDRSAHNSILVAELLGLETPSKAETTSVKYWFRQILTAHGAARYGKRTMWCFNTEIGDDVSKHLSWGFIKKHGLYTIEKQDDHHRRPILAISGEEVMDKFNDPVERVGKFLKTFLRDVIDNVPETPDQHPPPGKLNTRSAQSIRDLY